MDSVCMGYTLYAGMGKDPKTYLLDMDGKFVHQWKIGGMPVKMLPGGNLIGSKSDRLGKDPYKTDATPQDKYFVPWHDTIELVELDWNGRELWSFSNWDADGTAVMMSRQHHDFQREGNPVGYYAPFQEPVDKGRTLILAHINRDAPEICEKRLGDDVLYEVGWDGNLTGFEWHGIDHFEEYGFSKAEKAGLYKAPNYDHIKDRADWLHLNSASFLGKNPWYQNGQDERFNPDNIIISARNTNFIAVISKQNGSIVWKAGPHFCKSNPESKMGQIIGQHHAHMIPFGLPGAGNILIFDNGGMPEHRGPDAFPYHRGYSRVIEINPLSFDIIWQYGAEKGKEYFFSHFISSAQRLPNGNTLINSGAQGRFFEVTPDKEIVWEFTNPQGEGYGNRVYRAYRIPPEWVPGNPARYEAWKTIFPEA